MAAFILSKNRTLEHNGHEPETNDFTAPKLESIWQKTNKRDLLNFIVSFSILFGIKIEYVFNIKSQHCL